MVPLGGDVFPRRRQPCSVIYAQIESTDWDTANVYENSVVKDQISNSKDNNCAGTQNFSLYATGPGKQLEPILKNYTLSISEDNALKPLLEP